MDMRVVAAPEDGMQRGAALDPLLFGRDPTPGIVSITADRQGNARVWRRIGDRVVCEDETFPNWFFLARRELLDGLPVVDIPPVVLHERPVAPDGSAGLIQLKGANPFQYLVLTDQLAEVERHVADAAQRGLDDGTVTEPISELIYVRPAYEQYLAITGRTYFKGMKYSDVRRLQFDFETTGLGLGEDRIFMVSIIDSDGFRELLDTERMEEAELIRRLVTIIRDRDPDVIENHNIFDFDIRFLMKRAQEMAIPLPLGRDGTGFREARDSVKIGTNNQSFTRFSLAGREIVDTLHAARRFSAVQRDLRSNGLKEVARYFGVAAEDREYVDGPEIWNVFQQNPERVRRYCMDDVEEVDRLSAILLAPSFALASMVPKPYERVATAGTGQGLIEPILVRAYLAAGQSLPIGRAAGTYPGGRTAVFTTGVVENVVKADVASLYPSIMLNEHIGPAADGAGAFHHVLGALTRLRLEHKAEARKPAAPTDEQSYHDAMQQAMKVLINSFYGIMGADFALFCDKEAAARVTMRGREILQLLLDELQSRGAMLVEADTDGVLFSLPPRVDGRPWTYEDELALIRTVGQSMPAGIQLEHDGRYQVMYSYLEKNYALLEYEREQTVGVQRRDRLRLVGVAFRSSKAEALIERFVAEALRFVLDGDPGQIRDRFRDKCADLRRKRVPVVDLCVSMPLTKMPDTYMQTRLTHKEEPYEVYLAAGFTTWKPGRRISYYQARGGKRLFQESATDYDPEFYINRLQSTCMQRLEKAFRPEDLNVLLSEYEGLFDPPMSEIHTIHETRNAQLSALDDPVATDESEDELPSPDEPMMAF